MEGVLVFLLRMVRLGRRSIGQLLRFLLSLLPRGQGQHQHNEAQTRRTVAHLLILAWTLQSRTFVRRVVEVRAIRNP